MTATALLTGAACNSDAGAPVPAVPLCDGSERLTLRVQSLERGQQRRMDVQHPLREGGEEL